MPRQTMREAFRHSANILVITGAGISAESGIPTFRDPGGYWRSYDPAKLATWDAFTNDPVTVWEWYDHRRQVIASAAPNAAHRTLASLDKSGKSVFIITQNVDDLHERAGSANVVHIHGSIWEVTCLAERRTYQNRQVPLPEVPPRCACGGLLRPNVVWFDEELPAQPLEAISTYFNRHKPDMVLVIGTEGVFDYIGDFVRRATNLGATGLEINPSRTRISGLVDFNIHASATEGLQMLAGGDT